MVSQVSSFDVKRKESYCRSCSDETVVIIIINIVLLQIMVGECTLPFIVNNHAFRWCAKHVRLKLGRDLWFSDWTRSTPDWVPNAERKNDCQKYRKALGIIEVNNKIPWRHSNIRSCQSKKHKVIYKKERNWKDK